MRNLTELLAYLILNNGCNDEDALLMNIDTTHFVSGVQDMCEAYHKSFPANHRRLWCNQSVVKKTIGLTLGEIECHNCPFFTPCIQSEVLTNKPLGLMAILREPIAKLLQEEGVVIDEEQPVFNYQRYL